MSVLISRAVRPELFPDQERPLTDIVNAVESVYSMIGTKPEGYNQQELLIACRQAGIGDYEANIALTILFQTKKIINIIY